MALPTLSSEFGTNLMANRKVIEHVLQLKSAKAHGKSYIKVKPHLVRNLLRNRLLFSHCFYVQSWPITRAITAIKNMTTGRTRTTVKFVRQIKSCDDVIIRNSNPPHSV